MNFTRAFAMFGVSIVLSCTVVAVGASYLSSWQGRGRTAAVWAWLVVHGLLLPLHPSSLFLSNGLVLGSAVGAGVLLQRFVPTAGALVALSVAASVADIISFSTGPTRWLLEGPAGETWAGLPYLAVTLPMTGRPVPVVGIGDLLLFTAFFLGLTRLGVKRAASFVALASGLLVALGVGLLRGGTFGIPFMAVGVLLLLVPTIRRERRDGAVSG